MRKNYVAVLDVRSADITAVVGERGVNNTFIIKHKSTCAYDGYAEGELLDVGGFSSALTEVVKSTLFAASRIKTFYVGVPGEFLQLVNADKSVSFNSARRITRNDVESLVSAATPVDDEKWRTIRHSCLYYVLSDKRRLIEPVGTVSESLLGKFAFYKCNNAFIGCLMDAFKRFKGVTSVNLIPENQAEAMYLIEPEKRDECAVLFDFGYISSTYSVVCGNGLMYSESFSLGIGHIAALLMNDFDIPYEVALKFLSKVNLNAKEKLSSSEECVFENKTYEFSTIALRDKIREGLDGICETIETCIQSFTAKNTEGKPLFITGEGVNFVRGTAEHISGRLVRSVEVVAPDVPYYDKPQYSSLFSLLHTALCDKNS